MTNPSQLLAHTPIFEKFPPGVRKELVNRAVVRSLDTDEYLCHQGDQWKYVIFVLEGKLQWTILSISGREQVLFTVDTNDVFWGHSMFDNQPMPASLSAIKPTKIMRWHSDQIVPLLHRYPEALWELAIMFTGTMRKARNIIYGLAFQPVAARLAMLLLERFSDAEDSSVERDLTLNAIAARVASSPEVVCRILQHFQSTGVLSVTRATITLFDKEALERIVENK